MVDLRKSILVGLTLVLLASFYFANIAGTEPTGTMVLHPSSVSVHSDLTDHDPIQITSDADFETEGFPGNGTSDNPYMIDGLHIEEQGFHAIDIQNTRAWFVVNGSYLYAGVGTHGITIHNVSNAVIQFNIFSDVMKLATSKPAVIIRDISR